MAEKEKTEPQYQVRLVTKLPDVSVSDAAMTVPGSLDCAGMDNIVRGLLDTDDTQEFDWLCLGEILRGNLMDHVIKRNDITSETVIELEYIEKKLPPEPQVDIAPFTETDWTRPESDEMSSNSQCYHEVRALMMLFRCRPTTTTG